MATATEKQIAFIATMTEMAIAAQTPRLMTGQNDAKRRFVTTALILSLPTPATVAEASEQIDALKGDVVRYAQVHHAWAGGVMDAAQTTVAGDIRTKSPEGFELTPAQWAAYVRESITSGKVATR